MTAGNHRLLADEPIDVGGWTPGRRRNDLLLAALGSCTAMTLRLYAERRAAARPSVSVSLRHFQDSRCGLRNLETAPGAGRPIERRIRLAGIWTRRRHNGCWRSPISAGALHADLGGRHQDRSSRTDGAQPSRAALFIGRTTARSEAVVIDVAMPTSPDRPAVDRWRLRRRPRPPPPRRPTWRARSSPARARRCRRCPGRRRTRPAALPSPRIAVSTPSTSPTASMTSGRPPSVSGR